MDVDSAPVSLLPSPPISATPTATGFENLFYATLSPSNGSAQPKKRRSLSPESVSGRMENEGPSSPPPSSPSVHKFERLSNGSLLANFAKPGLQGLGVPSLANKRLRRPAFSAVVQPSEGGANSAYPVMDADASPDHSFVAHRQAGRRVVSAMVPPTNSEHLSDEFSFDGPDMSSPAQAYARRQQVKTIRRRDGTEDFRPLTGMTPAKPPMHNVDSPSAKFMNAGLPGFGDNETMGKILPCQRVREDGLMRIVPSTVGYLPLDDNLMDLFLSRWTPFLMVLLIDKLSNSSLSTVVSTTSTTEDTFQAQLTSTLLKASRNFSLEQTNRGHASAVTYPRKRCLCSTASSVPRELQPCE